MKTRPADSRYERGSLGEQVSEKAYWSKIAIAWAHKDGKGYNVQMDALPVDGKLVLRTVPEDHDDTGEVLERAPR